MHPNPYFKANMKHFKQHNVMDLSLKRHKMDKERLREIDWRRELYLIEKDKYGEKELFEINTQKLLDSFHCTLIYHDPKQMKGSLIRN